MNKERAAKAAKVQAVTDRVVKLLEGSGLNKSEISTVLHKTRAHYMLAEMKPGATTTKDFLTKIDGIGEITAYHLSQFYPCVDDLVNTERTALLRKYRVGQETLQKIYDSLLKEGLQPAWRP